MTTKNLNGIGPKTAASHTCSFGSANNAYAFCISAVVLPGWFIHHEQLREKADKQLRKTRIALTRRRDLGT
jgi:hypothetical protein